MKILNTQDLAKLIKDLRKKIGVTQKDVALTANVGIRFIVDLEKGKPTCQIEKTLKVLRILGVTIECIPPDIK